MLWAFALEVVASFIDVDMGLDDLRMMSRCLVAVDVAVSQPPSGMRWCCVVVCGVLRAKQDRGGCQVTHCRSVVHEILLEEV